MRLPLQFIDRLIYYRIKYDPINQWKIKMKKVIKMSSITIGLLLAALLLMVSLNWQTSMQLYHTITLFNKDKIVSNFSNLNGIMPIANIKKSGKTHQFGQVPQALPTTYRYQGEDKSLQAFLTRSSTTALLVLKGNDITFEDYYQGTNEFDQRISWSMAKSFLSALFGIAVEEGHIKSIHDLVTDYVPELKGSGYDGVTIKNVLQMSSGVAFNEDYQDFSSDINRMGRLLALGGSFDEFAASLVNEREQGTFLHYVSVDTHVIGMVLRKATGRTVVEYFKEKLWSKLGAEQDAYYITDSTGEPMVLGGLNMLTRDFAKFGKLYLDNGRWNDEQIVPLNWVTDSVTPDAPHLMPGKRDSSEMDLGYGYQWWLPVNADDEFMAIGVYDQFIYVNKKANVVIVKNSTNIDFMKNNFEIANETTEVFRAISAALK
jgi:CubicO group peptidase (beta-lactamase class C family)